MTESIQGLIIRSLSGFYTVRTDQGDFISRLRGRLKNVRAEEDIAAVGDRVNITVLPDGSGAIESVEPRKKALSRLLSGIKREYRQILLANPDQIALVFACAQPKPSLRMLDRFLVILEKQGIDAIIVANKADLIGAESARTLFGFYEPLGYKLIITSARTGLGVEELRQALIGRVTAFAGPSGVGKSSLLNAIQPELGLAVRSVSISTSKGMHTTQTRELFALNEGGYIADMPGLRTLALYDMEGEELDGYFRELKDLVSDCQFNDCTHQHEPGCAVIAAVENGQVQQGRYVSYLRMRFGDPEEDDDEIHPYEDLQLPEEQD